MPKVHHAHYAGGVGDRDVFVLENLLEAEYYNFENEKCLNEEHMKVRGKNDMKWGIFGEHMIPFQKETWIIIWKLDKKVLFQSVLDCLSYLHGAGLAYKHSLGGRASGVISISILQ